MCSRLFSAHELVHQQQQQPQAQQPLLTTAWSHARPLDMNASGADSRCSTLHSASSLNPTWESRYEELLRWRAEHGDTCVPKAEGALGRWVARQRELKRTGKLDSNREHALNSINFVWNTVTAMWEERFRKLSEWKKQHGHCAVPIAQGELGTWVSKQRQLRKRGKLSKEKIDALDSLKFTWSTAEADWEDKFKRLVQWTRTRGHASVPFNEGELGWWVNTQRQCKRKGKLSASREARLQSLGFVWNPSNSRSRAAAAAAAANHGTLTSATTSNTVLSSSGAISSADTTPSCTPEKADKSNVCVHDACSSMMMFPNELAFGTPYLKEEMDLFGENCSPICSDLWLADVGALCQGGGGGANGGNGAYSGGGNDILGGMTGATATAATGNASDSLLAAQWGASVLAAPLFAEAAGSGVEASGAALGVGSASLLDAAAPFGVGALLAPAATDELEQLLARDDGGGSFGLEQSSVDSLTCQHQL
eukprot:TRINITY_DN26_c0_g3_i17.p1 TRINITY_DN26_c0_g3~~TRINITY_DN26_c0_g3_i17.p1  ORF type:complete len:480 (-),score=116.10 TRINITY_DN26_c0_g3_i17:5722-7161(-)